jgi:hypothetical protein
VGLLFQPRWSGDKPRHGPPLAFEDIPSDRGIVFLAALEAVILGDASRFVDLFTGDIVFTSPHLVAESLPSVQHALGTPEDSLSDLDIVVLALDVIAEKIVAEWRLEAEFTRAVLYNDRLLVEPTGSTVCLPGASVAEFRGHQICAFRHYFDDSELLAGVPGTPTHLRWHYDC